MTNSKRPRRGRTIAEYEAWLKETGQYGAYLEEQRRREEDLARAQAEFRSAEAPLVEELCTAGIGVSSVWDLLSAPGAHPGAVPILLKHLRRPYPPPVRDGIARALAAPVTREHGWEVLIEEYKKERAEAVRQGLAAAIAACATEQDLDEVRDLARDRGNGQSRGLLLGAFARLDSPKARAAVMELAMDPDLAHEAQRILRKFNRRKKRSVGE